MRRWFPHPWGWASLAPLACAVHCALTPLLVVAVPALGPGERLEVGLLAATVPLAAWAVFAGLRRHRHRIPASIVGLGLLAWSGSLAGAYAPVPEEATTMAAALLVAGALIWNARLDCGQGIAPSGACARCEAEEAHRATASDRAPERSPEDGRRAMSNA